MENARVASMAVFARCEVMSVNKGGARSQIPDTRIYAKIT